MTKRRIGALTAAMSSGLLGIHAAVGQRGYVFEDLGTINGFAAYGSALSDDEITVGFSRDREYVFQAVMWDSSGLCVLPLLPGLYSAFAYGVDPSGTLIAGEMARGWIGIPVLWRESHVIDLGTFGGDDAFAADVNSVEQVVGQASNESGYPRPFLWERGVLRDLKTLGGSSGGAQAISESGWVVGWSLTETDEQRPTLWKDGEIIELAPYSGSALDINDADQIVGVLSEGPIDSFFWDSGQFHELPLFRVTALNNQGQIVGGDSGGAHLWEDGVSTPLRAYLGPCAPVDVLDDATDINDSGEILVRGVSLAYGLNSYRAVRMKPFSCGDITRLTARCRRA